MRDIRAAVCARLTKGRRKRLEFAREYLGSLDGEVNGDMHIGVVRKCLLARTHIFTGRNTDVYGEVVVYRGNGRTAEVYPLRRVFGDVICIQSIRNVPLDYIERVLC